MKIIITERQLNELMSLENYDAKTFISNKLIDTLTKITGHKKGRTVIGKNFITDLPNEKQIRFDAARINESSIIIDEVTNSIIDSIIEFYDVDNTPQNRKNITSLFYVDANEYGAVYLHINKGRDFKEIYDEGVGLYKDNTIIWPDMIAEMISKLLDKLKKKYPKWVDRGDFKKEKILPYKNTPFKSDDELSVGIYEWNVTFDTLEKLFYDFLFENLEDVEYEKYKTIIDRNMDRLKDYVEKNDYKKHIYFNHSFPHLFGYWHIMVLGQDKIYDKKYLYDYIYSLHDFGIEKKLFDKDFIDFLVMFRNFVIK
jgi:hypothetical protein